MDFQLSNTRKHCPCFLLTPLNNYNRGTAKKSREEKGKVQKQCQTQFCFFSELKWRSPARSSHSKAKTGRWQTLCFLFGDELITSQLWLGWDVPRPLRTRPAGPTQGMDSRAALCSSTHSSDLNASRHRASHRHPKAEKGNLNAIYAPVLQERPSTEAESLQDLELTTVKHLLRKPRQNQQLLTSAWHQAGHTATLRGFISLMPLSGTFYSSYSSIWHSQRQ